MKRNTLSTLAFGLFLLCGCTESAKKAFDSGVAASQTGDFDKAIADYTEAIRLDPKHADAYYGRAPPTGTRANTTRPSPTTREAIRLTRNTPTPISTGASPTGTRANATRPLPTTPRPSASIRNTTRPITIAATPTGTRANSTRPLPTARRPSGSTRNTPRHTTTGAPPTGTRANSTRPSPTTPRPSAWTRSWPWHIAAGAMPTRRRPSYDKAIADYNEAIRLDPKLARAYYHRGNGLRKEGREGQGGRGFRPGQEAGLQAQIGPIVNPPLHHRAPTLPRPGS